MKTETTVKDVEYGDIVDLLSTALYGSFWAYVDYPEKLRESIEEIDQETRNKYHVKGEICREETWATWLLKDPQNYIIIAEIEENYEDEQHSKLGTDYYRLTLAMLLEGWGKAIDKYKIPDLGDMDLYDADAVLQTAIFGEVIYG